MSKAIPAVVPVNIDRPKRIAKALGKLFPLKKLALSQATTAHLFGFTDWHSLKQATENKSSPGPFDEEISEEHLRARLEAQASIVAAELGDVDLAAQYPPPEVDPMKLLDTFGAGTEARLFAAHQRLKQVLAIDAINELAPTSRSHPTVLEPFDALCVYRTEELAAFPENLAHWWRVNLKHQPEVANEIANHEFDLKHGTSILLFGHYWGTLCMYYANTIDWRMIMGTSYILAEAYAAAKIRSTETYWDFAPRFANAKEDEQKEWINTLVEVKARLEMNFYRTFPRDDFLGIGSEVLLSNAKTCKKVFAKPKSRWGVWKHQ